MAYRINNKTEIVFAHEGENNAREIRFDVSGYPNGIIYLELLRYGDSYAYPITLDRDGNEAVWLPDSTATAKRGTGRGQLVVMADDEVIYKSNVFKLINRYSLATSDEVPDGYDSWIQRLETLGADIEDKTTDGLNAINEARDSALDRISTVSADGIEAINTAKTQGVSAINEAKTQGIDAVNTAKAQGIDAVNSAKTDSLEAIERKKDAVHTELDGYVAEHHDELKGDKGDAYVITEADKHEIADEVEGKYVTELGEIRETVSHKAEATDLATANRKIKALTDVLNGKELAFEKNDYESARVEIPSGAVADSILKIGGKSVVVDGELMSSQTDAVGVRGKNLINPNNLIIGQVPSIANGVLVSSPNACCTDLISVPSGDVTFSTGNTNTCYLMLYASDKSFIGYVNTSATVKVIRGTSITNYANARYCRIRFDASRNPISPMLEVGSVATPHKPYSYKQIPTNLPTLRSAGSVSDERVYGDVKKQYTRIGEVVVDGENIISFGISSANIAYVEIRNESLYGVAFPKANTMKLLTSNGFEPSTSGAVNNAYRVTEGSTYIYCNSFTSLDDAKKMLNDAPITVTYELAEPIITDIDPLPQLEAINVEAGGEVSFIDHSDMSFPIPTTHEFIVRNSEV